MADMNENGIVKMADAAAIHHQRVDGLALSDANEWQFVWTSIVLV
jgi:hypothetical protein